MKAMMILALLASAALPKIKTQAPGIRASSRRIFGGKGITEE